MTTFDPKEAPTRPDLPSTKEPDMHPENDDSTPGRDGAVSVRVTRNGWRAHVPTALITALAVAVLQAGGCAGNTEVLHRLDDLSTRVARIEGAMGQRLAVASHGAEGAGGTGSVAGD